LTVYGATRLELLANNRPIDPADFNGDGVVDAADYTVWRDTFTSTTDLRADANGDGFVNAVDYDLWSGGYRFGGSATTQAPEAAAAASAALGLGIATSTRQRRHRQ
jgi:hypothetical protein